jgi:hypothetical protein
VAAVLEISDETLKVTQVVYLPWRLLDRPIKLKWTIPTLRLQFAFVKLVHGHSRMEGVYLGIGYLLSLRLLAAAAAAALCPGQY